jgi:predicted NUDIX family NTP pyrophosphohydrolase
VEKTATYFLALVSDEVPVIEQDEVHEGGWFTLPQAQDRLTHTQAKIMLEKIQRDLHVSPV